MLRRILLYVLLVVAVAIGIRFLYRLDARVSHSESLLKGYLTMSGQNFVKVMLPDGTVRVFTKSPEETSAAWATRVASAIKGTEPMPHYLCDTLTGCEGGVSIEVCTACAAGGSQMTCEARHEADMQAFRDLFGCD